MVQNEEIVTSLIKRAVIHAFKALERFPLVEEDITVFQNADSYKCAIQQRGMTGEATASIRKDEARHNITLVGFIIVNRSYYSCFKSTDGRNWELKNPTTSST